MTTSKNPVFPFYDTTATIVIASSTTVSAAVDLDKYDLVGIFCPSTMEGTNLTFTAAITAAGTYVPVAASNAAATAYTIVSAASTYTPINPDVFKGLRYIKITAATVQTTTDTVFTLALRLRN